MSIQKYNVTGMSCAACQARVEKAVSKVPGVSSASVSLLTNSMGVEGTASAQEIIAAVEKAGYGAVLVGAAGAAPGNAAVFGEGSDAAAAALRLQQQEEALRDTETPKLRRRLIASVLILLILMYGSMGHMLLGWPLPPFFDGNHTAMGLGQMILAAIIMMINGKFFTSGFRSLLHRSPNMDTLVALGSMASFVWSVLILFKMTADHLAGDDAAVMADMESFYFESAAMIVTLITIGKMLEAMSKGRTTDALKGLLQLAPKTAILEGPDGTEQEVPAQQLRLGDVFIVRPGGSIPVDGIILSGSTAIDESALTGESIPVDKSEGDRISAATINTAGYIRAQATRVGEDTTLAQIIQMVSDAAATKAPIARIADRVSGIFVPVVIGLAVCVAAVWMLLGADTGYALARAISVLVVSCPCALGLATPVAIMVGNGIGARNGILFKTSASLEAAGRTGIIALDKTGTITCGKPVVTDVIAARDVSVSRLLTAAVSLETGSEHPIAGAILDYGAGEGIQAQPVTDFQALPGNGLQARSGERLLTGGSLSFLGEKEPVPDQLLEQAASLANQGKTPMLFAEDGQVLGMICVADTIKEDSPRAIAQLRKMGIHVVMLTGDNEKTAHAIGSQVGVDEVIAGVLPAGKEAVIRRLQERGSVCMVGDGINDAPALTRAETGIAIGAGADVAIDAADVVLMNSRLTDVAAAIRLSRMTLRNIHENLFWAFIYNLLLIPLAAGAYVHLMGGWSMNPMLGAAAMSLSSFCVCMNALRLNLKDIYDDSRDRPRGAAGTSAREHKEEAMIRIHEKDAKEEIMKKTLNIEGMMCPHCEATVKKALEALDGVREAQVSHEAGTAVVALADSVEDAVLTKAVEDKDFKVLSVEA